MKETRKFSLVYYHILSNLEVDSKLTLQAVDEECERIMNLKHDREKIQERDVFQVQGVHQKLKKG